MGTLWAPGGDYMIMDSPDSGATWSKPRVRTRDVGHLVGLGILMLDTPNIFPDACQTKKCLLPVVLGFSVRNLHCLDCDSEHSV